MADVIKIRIWNCVLRSLKKAEHIDGWNVSVDLGNYIG